jgi:hypothetical protein
MEFNIQIATYPIDKLIPYSRNPRKNDQAVDRMAGAIREFGFKIPILARTNGEVVDGHLRLKAAQKLQLESVPVIWCDEWTPAQVKAFRLLVNRSASWADWDDELLGLELADLKTLNFDLALTGFSSPEIEELLWPPLNEDIDQAPELPTDAVTQAGDLWLCGVHRVLCGDATDADSVARLLGGAAPMLMVTEPHGEGNYDSNWREPAGLGKMRQTRKIAHDWTEAYRLFPGDVAYVWHAGINATMAAQALENARFEIRSQIIWAEQHFALGHDNYHCQHHPCWYAVRQGRPAHWCGDRSQSTLWQVSDVNPLGNRHPEETVTGHRAQKPVELMRRALSNHGGHGVAVYDPFLGSGSTLVAADTLGRVCCGLEMDERYVDVVVRRWQKMSGAEAHLEGDGQSFEQVGKARRAHGTTAI